MAYLTGRDMQIIPLFRTSRSTEFHQSSLSARGVVLWLEKLKEGEKAFSACGRLTVIRRIDANKL